MPLEKASASDLRAAKAKLLHTSRTTLDIGLDGMAARLTRSAADQGITPSELMGMELGQVYVHPGLLTVALELVTVELDRINASLPFYRQTIVKPRVATSRSRKAGLGRTPPILMPFITESDGGIVSRQESTDGYSRSAS
jgi:hypothetical protein